MNSAYISDEEYKKLIDKLHFFNTERNALLTFSFTAVLAILGVIVGAKNTSISYWICVIPYFLILPFTARIAYYRLASAHINSFLKTFAKEKMVFEIGTQTVPEGSGIAYRVIAWLVNHEMFLLSIATLGTFLYQLSAQVSDGSMSAFLPCLVPVGFTLAVLFISNSVYSYKNLSEEYNKQWNTYYENHIPQGKKCDT